MEQDNNILSSDYTVAENAFEKAVLEKNKNTIRLGLKSQFLDIEKKAVERIAEINDKTSVPNLIVALQENQGVIGGGSETQVLQNELNKAIISALEHLTKLEFKVSKRLSSEDIKGYKPFSSEEIQEILDKTSDWCKSPKTDVQKIVEESREWYQANEPEIQQAVISEMLERQQATPILSKNYNVAKWALDKAILEKDLAIIKLGLKGFSLQIRKDVVDEIKKIGDKSFVPDLANALEDNQGCLSGGSETEMLQKDLNDSIVSALKQITELKFSEFDSSKTLPCSNEFPPKDIQEILKESRTWWQIHQGKDK